MRDRQLSSTTRAGKTTLAVDVVVISPRSAGLAVLLVRTGAGARERWQLPWDAPRAEEELEHTATRITSGILGGRAAFAEQIGAFSDARRHPGNASVSVGVITLIAAAPGALGGTTSAAAAAPTLANGAEWFALRELPPLAPRHRAIVDRAAAVIRQRVDQSPLAFRLLPQDFTLTELQEVYELIMGRRLHKASFRRALQASYLVEPTDQWRSEGRGRPAQLFRYAPKKRRGSRRGVRFDLFSE